MGKHKNFRRQLTATAEQWERWDAYLVRQSERSNAKFTWADFVRALLDAAVEGDEPDVVEPTREHDAATCSFDDPCGRCKRGPATQCDRHKECLSLSLDAMHQRSKTCNCWFEAK